MNTDKRKAKKLHRCTLCKTFIERGEVYHYERITPWAHPINEFFFDYKAHKECHEKWLIVGSYFDNIFPNDQGEWCDMIEGLEVSQ